MEAGRAVTLTRGWQLSRPFARPAQREEEVIRERYPMYLALPCQKVETMRPLVEVVEEIVYLLQQVAESRGRERNENLMRYDKLVRDRIPEIIEANGEKAITRKLEPEEFIFELKKKLQEEVDEYLASADAEELVDILEVVYSLARSSGLEQFERIRVGKLAERGGFSKRVFLEETRAASEATDH